MTLQCKSGCTFTVVARRDNPDDPEYPVVVCPHCMTRWFGHRDDRDSKPLNPNLPPALRDAILLDQAEAAFAILENELGYSKAVRPNACIGVSTPAIIHPGHSLQVTARPQSGSFRPTHFVTNSEGFSIDDIRIGNHSIFIQSTSIPSEAFRINLVAPDLVLRPGQKISTATIEIVAGAVDDSVDDLPLACSSFKWGECLTAMDLVVAATNISALPRTFESWFLGRQDEYDPFSRRGRQ